MKPLTPKAMHYIATHPQAYAKLCRGGSVQGVKPASPLITLLRKLGPRALQRIRGVVIDARLGYTGSRRFHYAAQALHWIAPDQEVFGAFPTESWRDKCFTKKLYLEDLAACCADFPPEFLTQYKELCRPTPLPVVSQGQLSA